MMRFLLACCVLAFAGCDTPPPSDVLRVGISSLPPSWGDPYRADGTPSTYVWTAVFDGLTALGPDGKIVPALATNWSTQDGKVWDFDLRKGVTFSNGQAFDAEAAAKTFQFLMSKQGRASVVGSRVRSVSAVEVRAPYQLRITLSQSDAIFYKRLPSVAIVEPALWRKDRAAFALNPVGTGPYRLDAFDTRKRRAYLSANATSWRAPGVPKLELIELTDGAVRQQALISGDVDIARVSVDEVPYLKSRNIRIETARSMQVMSIAFNTEGLDSPLDDIRVRQALNYAVDKQAMAQYLMNDLSAPASQPGALGTTGFNPAVKPYPFDLQKARALLAQAGYADGFSMRIEAVVGSLPQDALIYQSVVDQLKDVGVDAQLQAIPFPVFLRRYLSNTFEVEAFGLSWSAAPFNDIQRPMENFSCLKRPAAFFCDETLAKGIRATGTLLDEAARLEALQALAKGHHDAAPALFLVEQVDVTGLGPRITGTAPLANRIWMYERIALRQ